MRTFKQLTARDRVMISRWKSAGISLSEMARRLGKNKSTLSRELKRNAQVSSTEDQLFWLSIRYGVPITMLKDAFREYAKPLPRPMRHWTASEAQHLRDFRLFAANQKRRRKSTATVKWVIEKLKQGWSPEQIAGRSKINGPGETVSHEFVYELIIKDRRRGGTLYRHLKRFRKRKQRIAQRVYREHIPNRIGIENRPKVVDSRRRLGDLEADLIQGYCNSGYVLCVVDRKSKRVELRKLKTKHAKTVTQELGRAIKRFGKAHTLTVDNGREFSHHDQLRRRANIDVYFTHPYCSTERGTVENTNGLIRYYLPKKTSFQRLSQRELRKIQVKLNNRPRKCLEFLTPEEVHFRRKTGSPKSLHL